MLSIKPGGGERRPTEGVQAAESATSFRGLELPDDEDIRREARPSYTRRRTAMAGGIWPMTKTVAARTMWDYLWRL